MGNQYYSLICFLIGAFFGMLFIISLFTIKILWLMREIKDMLFDGELGDG